MTSALQNEAEWLPDDRGNLATKLELLHTRLTDAGRPSAEVYGITGWIVAKALGQSDTTSSRTRAKYRRILRELDADPTDDPKRSSRRPGAGSQPPIIIGAAGDVMSGRRRRKVAAMVRAALDELLELPRGA